MVQRTVLDNGVRVLTERLEQAYSVTMGLWMEVGSRDEAPREGGASHFVEHMAFKGTSRRDALSIAQEIDRLGGMANAFTSKEHTCFHARALANHLPEITDLLTDILLRPAYDPVELERERGVILQEISSVEDTPDELVHVMFASQFWGDHALGRPVLGSVETVSGLGRQALLDYLGANYAPGRMVVTAVGDLEHQDVLAQLEECMAGLPAAEDGGRQAPAEHRPGLEVMERSLEQAHLILGAPAPSSRSADRFTAALLNVILGGSMSSRLFQEVREKRGLAYAVYSYLSSYSDSGLMGVYLGVSPAKAAESLKVALGELAKLAESPVLHEELADAKEHLKGSLLLALENPESRMSRLARNEFNFGREVPVEDTVADLEAVEVEDISQLAGRILDPANLTVTVLGPVDGGALAQELGR